MSNIFGGHGVREAHRHRTWGISGTLITGDTNKIVTIQTGDLSESGYAYYTIMFGIDVGEAIAPTAVATISWIVNGNAVSRQVTVGNGVEISGPADAISLRIDDKTPETDYPAGTSYSVTALIVPGSRVGGNTQPLLNGGVTAVAAASATNIPIPQNAGVVGAWVSFFTTDGSAPKAVVREIVLTSSSNLFGFGLVQSEPIYVPIVAGADTLHVINDGAVDGDFSVVWAIDG